MNHSISRRVPWLAAAGLLAGCASFSPDGGMGVVSDLTRERTGHPVRSPTGPATERTSELLAAPLTADGAVELAFLHHRGLQASFARLGIAEADLVQAGRLHNPVFGFGRMSGGGVVTLERSVVVGVLELLTLPANHRLQQRSFEQSQLRAASDAVALASQVKRAYYDAVASGQLVGYQQQVKEAADASSELAQRMLQAGNFNKLARLREQSFQADATADLARATQQAFADRERLVRLTGLSGGQLGFKLPERLPDLPQALAEPQDLEKKALARRLDVRMAEAAADAAAASLGITRATRFVDAASIGYRDERETGSPKKRGVEVELEVPLFDFGSVRTTRATASLREAEHHAADVALQARSEARESHAAYRTAYELARHYRDEVVPLRRRISEENLLRYNGMLIGVFDLLADAREQVRGVTGSVEALRDFWIADARLQAALAGGTADPTDLPDPISTRTP